MNSLKSLYDLVKKIAGRKPNDSEAEQLGELLSKSWRETVERIEAETREQVKKTILPELREAKIIQAELHARDPRLHDYFDRIEHVERRLRYLFDIDGGREEYMQAIEARRKARKEQMKQQLEEKRKLEEK